jgi:hypothetical protein
MKKVSYLLLFLLTFWLVTICQAGKFSEMGGYGVSTVGGASYDYANLYDAATDFNAYPGGCTGNWTILINGNLSESKNVAFGNTVGTNTVTLKPAPGVQPTITFTVTVDNPGISGNLIIGSNNTTSLDLLTKTDNFVIDGSNNGTSSQDLILQNTAASIANANIVRVFGDCDNFTIKNTIIKNLSTSGSSNYGLQFTSRLTTGGTVGLHPDNSRVENCSITSIGGPASQAIGFGNSGTCPTGFAQDNIIIKGNLIVGRTRGIYMGYVANGTLSYNTVRLIQTSSGYYSSVIGHWGANGVTNFTMNIYNNVIDTVTTANIAAGDYGVIALEIDNAGIYNVYNNMFCGFTYTGTTSVGMLYGAIRGNAVAATYNIYQNSIYLANQAGRTGLAPNRCYGIGLTGGGTYVGSINIKNNLIQVDQKGGAAIYLNIPNFNGTADINYNDLSADTAAGAFTGFINEGFAVVTAVSLADWQAQYYKFDANSQSVSPLATSPGSWVSATNLHFSNTSASPLLAGQWLNQFVGSDKDIDGNARNVANPTVGAVELNMYGASTVWGTFTNKALGSNGVPAEANSIVQLTGYTWSPTSFDTTAKGLFRRFVVDTATQLPILVQGSGMYQTNDANVSFNRGDLLSVTGVLNYSAGMYRLLTLSQPQNLGTSAYSFSIATAASLQAAMAFDSTAATGGEYLESRPMALSNVTVLRTTAIGTTLNYTQNAFQVEIGDYSSNSTGGYILQENLPYKWMIPQGSNIPLALNGKVLMRGQVIPTLVGTGYQISTSGKAGYYIVSVTSTDLNIPEIGKVFDKKLNWIWSTPTVYNLYKAANGGSDVFNSVSIQTGDNWPDISRATDLVRNFAYNPVLHHIYTNSRDTIAPYIIDAATGSVLGTLPGDSTIINTGIFPLARLQADANGNIYGCNLHNSMPSVLKIYKWADETSLPTVLVNTTLSTGTSRVGDGFKVQTMDNGTVLLSVTGSGNPRIWVFDGNGNLFAAISTQATPGSGGVAEFDPENWNMWYKRYGLPTYVIPSSAWLPTNSDKTSFVNYATQSIDSIGTDLIPYQAVSLSIVKQRGKKFLVTHDLPSSYYYDASNGTLGNVQASHALIFDITGGLPSATGLSIGETKYYGRSGNCSPVKQPAAAINSSGFASMDKYGNIIVVTENMSLASWQGPASYVWNGSVSSDWTTAGNWTPARTVVSADDNLIFDGASTAAPVITAVPNETVGSLLFTNNCYATLTSTSDATCALIVTGGPQALYVKQGSTLKLSGSKLINLVIASGSAGLVEGDVILNATAASVPHRILVSDADGLIINPTGTVTLAPTTTGAGNAFGGSSAPTSAANAVRFKAGSYFYQGGLKDGTRYGGTGSNPFARTAPASNVVFDDGSYYVTWESIPSISGRTYGYFVWRNSVAQGVGGGSVCTVKNDFLMQSSLTTSNGNLNLNAQTGSIVILGNLVIESTSGAFVDTSTPSSATNIEVKGHIIVQNPANFTPGTNANRTYLLSGSSAQQLDVGGKALPNLTINNPAGVNVVSPVGVVNTLSMVTGDIINGSNVISLNGSTLNRTAGTIQGTFARVIPATAGSYLFPIGTASTLNEATVTFAVAPTTGTLTASFVASAPGTNGLPLQDGDYQVTGISSNGYWSIAGGVTGSYDLSLVAGGFGDVSAARVLKRANSSSAWTADGAQGTNSTSVVVRTGCSGFSEFGISSLATPLDYWMRY